MTETPLPKASPVDADQPAAPLPEGALRVEIQHKITPFRGYFHVDRYRLRHETFAGGWSQTLTREVFERGHAAALLPYDAARDQVILIEQFRPGAHAAGLPAWLIEAVAGIIEEGETPVDVVRREAVEEAGCQVTDLVPVGTYLMTPGASSETIAAFCGRVDSDGCGGIHGLAEEGEDIRVLVMPTDRALDLLNEGRINNAMTVILLQWLALNRPAMRARWAP